MKLFVCIFDDARLLPHFLRHYESFGVSEFHIAAPLALSDYVSRQSQGYAARQYNDLNVADSFIGGVSAVTEMRNRAQAPDEWVVIVDLDEFVEFGEPVQNIVRRLDAGNYNIARGIMYDRFAIDGKLTVFDDHSNLASLYPVRARLTKQVMGGVDIKGVIVKGHLRSRGAHHKFHDERPLPGMLEISHYKWNEKALNRVRKAYDDLSECGIGWAVQYKKILDHYDAHGRFAWETFGGEVVSHSKIKQKEN